MVRVGDGRAMVVDAGGDPAPVRQCLDRLGVAQVPLLVLTHYHADHVDGLPGVLQRRAVGAIWDSPMKSPAAQAALVAEAAAARQIPVATPEVGTETTVGEAHLRVLGPVPASGPDILADADEESSAENDASLVLLVTVRGLRILLTGDVEPAGQRAILATGADLRADVLKLPHHGSSRQDRGFIAQTGARVAIASAGRDNSYGHPAPRVLHLAAALGMTVLRTDLQGSVAITVRAGRIAAVAQRA